jgi:hypothetical protein
VGTALIAAQSTSLGGIIGQLLRDFSSSGRNDVLTLLNRYLFSTVDVSRPGSEPLTSNAALAGLNQDVSRAGDALLALVVVVIALRAVLERSVDFEHALRAMLPKVLVGVILMHTSLTLRGCANSVSD